MLPARTKLVVGLSMGDPIDNRPLWPPRQMVILGRAAKAEPALMASALLALVARGSLFRLVTLFFVGGYSTWRVP
jgi:hypothetical protein